MKNKILTILLSVAIALGLWMYVVTFVATDIEETFQHIPVALQGEAALRDKGLMITSDNHDGVTLQLAGNRLDMLKLSNSNITLTADLSQIYEAGEHYLAYSIFYPGNVSNNAITVKNRNPDRILVKVEQRVTKTLEVELSYTGTLPDGLIFDKENATLSKETITVTGPKSVMDQVSRAVVVVDLSGRQETINGKFPVELRDAHGRAVTSKWLEMDATELNLNLKIETVKELPIKVTVISGGGASSANTTITVAPKSIRVSGSKAKLETMTELKIVVDLGQIMESGTYTYPIELPQGVSNVSGINEATVTIQLPELEVTTVQVTIFKAINVPEGLEAEIYTESLDVTLRGPEAQIRAITEEDVILVVDFANELVDSPTTMKATIQVGENFPDVGAVGGQITVRGKLTRG